MSRKSEDRVHCGECGAVGAGDDGLCKACRAVERGEYESRFEYMAELGRKGGSVPRRRSKKGLNPERLPPLQSHRSVKVWLSELAQGVVAGEVDRQLAGEVRKLLRRWMDAHKGELVDEKLEELEERLEELQRQRDGRPQERALRA